MLKRTITAGLIIAVVAGAFLLGDPYFSYLIKGIILMAGYEVYRIKKDVWPKYLLALILAFLYSVSIFSDSLYIPIISFLVFILFFISIINEKVIFEDVSFIFLMLMILSLAILSIENIMNLDIKIFIYLIIATYATDTFAYLGGSLFGKNKLIERISPNKTIEGAISGYIASVILSIIFAHYFLELNTLYLASSFLIPIISQIGDLSFSLIKRHYQIKDFGKLLPGHGGVLDRIDSIVFSLLAFNAILSFYIYFVG